MSSLFDPRQRGYVNRFSFLSLCLPNLLSSPVLTLRGRDRSGSDRSGLVGRTGCGGLANWLNGFGLSGLRRLWRCWEDSRSCLVRCWSKQCWVETCLTGLAGWEWCHTRWNGNWIRARWLQTCCQTGQESLLQQDLLVDQVALHCHWVLESWDCRSASGNRLREGRETVWCRGRGRCGKDEGRSLEVGRQGQRSSDGG